MSEGKIMREHMGGHFRGIRPADSSTKHFAEDEYLKAFSNRLYVVPKHVNDSLEDIEKTLSKKHIPKQSLNDMSLYLQNLIKELREIFQKEQAEQMSNPELESCIRRVTQLYSKVTSTHQR